MCAQTLQSPSKNWHNYAPLAISITLLMYSVSGFTFFDLYANRSVVEFISLLFVIIFGYKYFLIGIIKPVTYQSLFVASLLLFMSFHMYDISYIVDVCASLFIVVLINGADIKLTDKMLSYLSTVTTILSVFGLLLFIFALIDPGLIGTIGYGSQSEQPLRFLGSIQRGYEIGGVLIPRSQSFAYEPSFLPAYMGIPFVFLICLKGKYFAKFTILSFLLITTAGSVYSFLALSVLAYLMMKYFGRKPFLFLLICSVPIYFYFLIAYVTPFEPAVGDANKMYGEMIESAGDLNPDLYLQDRAFSAALRIGAISWSLQAALQHPFGMPDTLNTVNGLLIYGFVTAGILGFIFSLLLYIYILNKIYLFFISSKENLKMQVALALLAGICIQAFMFNDYGYTTVHGMPLLALAIKKLQGRSTCKTNQLIAINRRMKVENR